MTLKEKFTPEEWRLLQETLTLSGLLVMIAAGPSSTFGRAAGLFKETNALYLSLSRMLSHGSAYPLIDELRLDLRSSSGMQIEGEPDGGDFRDQSPEQVQRTILERCRRTAQLLHQKAEPVEAAYYKKGLLWVCAQIAQAANEQGGILGSSKQPISDEERQVIRQIAFALGMSAAEPLVEELPTAPRRIVPTQVAGLMNPEEWHILREAPIWISSAILLASPSGVMGTLREVTTLIRTLRSARERFPENRLIDALVDDLGILAAVGGESPFFADRGSSPQQAFEKAVAACHQAANLLQAKAQGSDTTHGPLILKESLEYKQMLVDMAHQVAGSAREGGFLGIGSRRISAEEQALLDAVTQALNL